jgi:hypothetical protein
MKHTEQGTQETRTPCFDFLSMSDTRDESDSHLMHDLGLDKGPWDCDMLFFPAEKRLSKVHQYRKAKHLRKQ